jgi:hypothetical protein
MLMVNTIKTKDYVMRGILLGLLFCYGNVYAELSKPVAVQQNYVCEKGERKITLKLVYRDVLEKAPCRLYQVVNKKKTIIANSKRTDRVCRIVLDKVLEKLGSEGMTCALKESAH